MKVPNLRSPHDQVGGFYYFGRMVDKIRLHAAGQLPEVYQSNLGTGFDGRCCSFLGINYEDIVAKTKEGLSDEQLLAWARENGSNPSEEQVEVWNGFMSKRGWKDAGTSTLERRKRENGFENREDIETMFDYIDADEERPIPPKPIG